MARRRGEGEEERPLLPAGVQRRPKVGVGDDDAALTLFDLRVRSRTGGDECPGDWPSSSLAARLA